MCAVHSATTYEANRTGRLWLAFRTTIGDAICLRNMFTAEAYPNPEIRNSEHSKVRDVANETLVQQQVEKIAESQPSTGREQPESDPNPTQEKLNITPPNTDNISRSNSGTVEDNPYRRMEAYISGEYLSCKQQSHTRHVCNGPSFSDHIYPVYKPALIENIYGSGGDRNGISDRTFPSRDPLSILQG